MNLIAELKRRNVHRAAMFYAASAWLLVQIATQVFPFFHIAEWAVRWIVIAAAIGFTFAIPSPALQRPALALVYFAQSDIAKEQAQLAEIIPHAADHSEHLIADIYALRGNADQAFAWLDRELPTQDPGTSALYEDPFLAHALRNHPRLTVFTRKLGLPDPSTVPDAWATPQPKSVP